MRREQLEHVLRAASTVVHERDVLVIGSQSVLASIPDDRLPPEATTSIEADLAFFDDPADEKADQVDGAIGELSQFHGSQSNAQGSAPPVGREDLDGRELPEDSQVAPMP